MLVQMGVRTAIDISDGLVSDMGHICRASQLSARIRLAAVPVARAARTAFGTAALELALTGGEDYELLFTAPASVMTTVETSARAEGCPVTVIGEMVRQRDTRVLLLDNRGQELEPGGQGWDHFATESHGA